MLRLMDSLLRAQGLALHGRGQWGQALNVFAGAVGDELAFGLTGM